MGSKQKSNKNEKCNEKVKKKYEKIKYKNRIYRKKKRQNDMIL